MVFVHPCRSLALLVVAGTMLLGTTTAREARPMSREFFIEILFTFVEEAEYTEGDNSTNPLNDWDIQTEWNWNYSLQIEEEQDKRFPFILCNDNVASSSVERRSAIAQGSNNTVDSMFTIFNKPSGTCVITLVKGSIAAGLKAFIVQPIGFMMKLNSGTVDFVSDETKAREYAIQICPGLPWLDLQEFMLGAIADIVPMIDFLLTVPEVEPFKPDLTALQQELDREPTFCDDVLVANVEAEQAGVDYVILRLVTPEDGFAPEACFLLLALGLAHTPEICFIERREEYTISNLEAQWIVQSGVLEQRPFFDVGISGKGQVVSVSDTGLDLDNCYFRDAVEPLEFGIGFNNASRKVVQYVNFTDSVDYRNGHGTHVCGTIAGKKAEDGINESNGFVDGVAPDAKLAFFDVGIGKRLTVPGATALLTPGILAGARIHSASWGSKSIHYTNQDKDFDRFMYDDDSVLIVVAAGNKGPLTNTVGSPANAKNILTVGASTSTFGIEAKQLDAFDDLASFSSRGPSMDERFKPDVVAPGSYILSAGATPGELSCDPPSANELPGPGVKDSQYGVISKKGTSMATPVVSGLAAMVRQYFQEGWYGDGTRESSIGKRITGTLIKAILINGAQPLRGYEFDAVDANQGFGRVSLIDSLPLAGKNNFTGEFYDEQTVAENGEPAMYEFVLDMDGEESSCDNVEMSVTLVWPDPPGYVSCRKCLLNDLDLLVEKTSSDGTTTRHFPNGREDKDSFNNVERVRLHAADGDAFLVLVTADHLQSAEQKFALAYVYGCFDHRSATATPETSSAPRFLTRVMVTAVCLVGAVVSLHSL